MHNPENSSKTKIIASTNVFQIEKVEKVGREDYPQLIEISLHLAKEYGRQAVLTKDTIQKYFNTEKSLPFIARYQDENCCIYRCCKWNSYDYMFYYCTSNPLFSSRRF